MYPEKRGLGSRHVDSLTQQESDVDCMSLLFRFTDVPLMTLVQDERSRRPKRYICDSISFSRTKTSAILLVFLVCLNYKYD